MDPCIYDCIKTHKDNKKVKELLDIISGKISFWNRTVMPETFRVIKDFLHDDSLSVELDFCSDEFPKHFKAFSEMLATLREEFPIELYMKINHVCQQHRYRVNGIPISIYNCSFNTMEAFHTLFGEVDTDTTPCDELKLEKLLHKAGVSSRVIDTMQLDAIVWTRDYKVCLLYTSPSPRDRQKSRMPSSA